MKFMLVILAGVLTLVITGCASASTWTANPPPLSEIEAASNSEMGFGIYPAGYDIDNYRDDYSVVLKFTVGNDLDYPSMVSIKIKLPLDFQVEKNPGYVRWDKAVDYCQLTATDLSIPANSDKKFNIRVYIPEGVEFPDKWMFYVAYQLEGNKWGRYVVTSQGNFVFIPSSFECSISDSHQEMVWLTWGNSPELMVRAAYGSPPETIGDGELLYQGYGQQVIRDWLNPDSGKVLDRQYTLYTISDNKLLPLGGGTTLFYRAWQAHRVNGVWDGTWDMVGQSMVVPEVWAKVLVSK